MTLFWVDIHSDHGMHAAVQPGLVSCSDVADCKDCWPCVPMVLIDTMLCRFTSCKQYRCYIYSTVGRSIADIYDLRRHILYTMVSAQQTNLLPKMLREMTSFLPKKYIGYMRPLRNT